MWSGSFWKSQFEKRWVFWCWCTGKAAEQAEHTSQKGTKPFCQSRKWHYCLKPYQNLQPKQEAAFLREAPSETSTRYKGLRVQDIGKWRSTECGKCFLMAVWSCFETLEGKCILIGDLQAAAKQKPWLKDTTSNRYVASFVMEIAYQWNNFWEQWTIKKVVCGPWYAGNAEKKWWSHRTVSPVANVMSVISFQRIDFTNKMDQRCYEWFLNFILYQCHNCCTG